MKPLRFLQWIAIAAYAITPNVCCAQLPDSNSTDLKPGLFLVAPRDPADASFAKTVILLLTHDGSGTMGLVINRRTDIPISRVLDKEKRARHMSQAAYSGGPVQQNAVLALFRSNKNVGSAATVLNDIHLISKQDEFDLALRFRPSLKNFRVYLGYTGWAPGQLEHEMDLEVWRTLPGDEESVFDPDPDAVWMRLIERTELRFALLLKWRSNNTTM